MTNFTSGHESRRDLLYPARLAFPPNHIEVDNRLTWQLGRFAQQFGDEAYYVHFVRNVDEVAESYNQRWYKRASIVLAYKNDILYGYDKEPDISYVYDMPDCIGSNIVEFLSRRPHVTDFRLEDYKAAFPDFWGWVGAEGSLDTAMSEWSIRHNMTI